MKISGLSKEIKYQNYKHKNYKYLKYFLKKNKNDELDIFLNKNKFQEIKKAFHF